MQAQTGHDSFLRIRLKRLQQVLFVCMYPFHFDWKFHVAFIQVIFHRMRSISPHLRNPNLGHGATLRLTECSMQRYRIEKEEKIHTTRVNHYTFFCRFWDQQFCKVPRPRTEVNNSAKFAFNILNDAGVRYRRSELQKELTSSLSIILSAISSRT